MLYTVHGEGQGGKETKPKPQQAQALQNKIKYIEKAYRECIPYFWKAKISVLS